MLVSLLANMLTPVAARYHAYCVIFLRVIMGMAQVSIKHIAVYFLYENIEETNNIAINQMYG